MNRSTVQKLVPFYTHNHGEDDRYTLYVDKQTKDIVKVTAKNVSPSKMTLFIILGYPIVNYFPVDIIPLNNIFVFISMSVFLVILSVMFGHYLSLRMVESVTNVSLSRERWEQLLKEGNKFYIRQLFFLSALFLISIICFVFLYIYSSIWLLFGGILSCVAAGPFLTFFSKTRYLLYRNKLDVNLNNGGTEDEDIIYW